MGKQKKRKREQSQSSEHSRSRSRSKPKKHSDSKESDGQIRNSSSYYKALTSFKHQYYLSNESKSIGLPYVVWNLCIRLAARPSLIFIICESMAHLATIQRACRLSRTIKVVDETAHSNSIDELIKQKAEVIMTTQKKCSIIMAVEEHQRCFDAIINVSKCFDPDFYTRASDLAKQGATLVTFAEAASSIKKLSETVRIDFQECESRPTENQFQRQLISDVHLAPKPTSQTLTMVKNLGISFQQAAGRLLELEKLRREPPKSIHLAMPGYITYRLDMDVQFNSLKYVWNFLREQFPRSLYDQVRGMQKYQNEKGVVLNIPQELRYMAETVAEKLKRHKTKFKGIELEECTSLPPLEDTDSEEYKLMREKKRYAMENKRELEIFIGGVPYQMEEGALKLFFREKGVNLFLVRILKDQKGFSKGIGFGLCQNHEHFERAIQLNGSRFMDRTIRVKLADQRKD